MTLRESEEFYPTSPRTVCALMKARILDAMTTEKVDRALKPAQTRGALFVSSEQQSDVIRLVVRACRKIVRES